MSFSCFLQTFSSGYVITPMAAAAQGAWDCGFDEPLYPGRASKFTSTIDGFYPCSGNGVAEIQMEEVIKAPVYSFLLKLLTLYWFRLGSWFLNSPMADQSHYGFLSCSRSSAGCQNSCLLVVQPCCENAVSLYSFPILDPIWISLFQIHLFCNLYLSSRSRFAESWA